MTTTEPQIDRLTSIAPFIDHTCLTFSPGEDEESRIVGLCAEAVQYGFFAVCVRPRHISIAKQCLQESAVKVAAVIGFPAQKVLLGDELKQSTVGELPLKDKLSDARRAVLDGADELDIVIPVAQLKREMAEAVPLAESFVFRELVAIREVALSQTLKVILETDLLSDDEINGAAVLCAQAGMNMLKTSTGMVTGGIGATVDVVRKLATALMQPAALDGQTTGEKIGIKASGGIKSQAQALDLLKAGANRLGTSSGVDLMMTDKAITVAY